VSHTKSALDKARRGCYVAVHVLTTAHRGRRAPEPVGCTGVHHHGLCPALDLMLAVAWTCCVTATTLGLVRPAACCCLGQSVQWLWDRATILVAAAARVTSRTALQARVTALRRSWDSARHGP